MNTDLDGDDGHWFAQISLTNNGVQRMVTTKSYDNLNGLTGISSSSSASFSSSFNYSYNSANQRTSVTNADTSRWVYTYDSLGQVTSGKKYWNDGTNVAGQQFEYAFDDIGNRKWAMSGGDQYGSDLRQGFYTNNALNQITSRTVPGYVDIIGEATNTATVTVNDQPTYRHDEYFRAELTADNSASALWFGVTNLAVINDGTNADIVASATGNVFVVQSPELFGYDADGNRTNDGRWTLAWDGENRLLTLASLTNNPAESKRRLTFGYDYRGRRITKAAESWNGSAWVMTVSNKFLYDGWNLIAELNPTNNAVIRSYVWGLDLSGQTGSALNGAGGVGGLLLTRNSELGTQNFVAYDGNGNVVALVNSGDGTESANYEYGPFGELIRASGEAALLNPFRFSTKYQDDETDLLYYGYRYYDARNGGWLSRDPIEEDDGPNTYAFVRNSPANLMDMDGREAWALSGPGWSTTYQNGQSVYSRHQYPSPPDDLQPETFQIPDGWSNFMIFDELGSRWRRGAGDTVILNKSAVFKIANMGTFGGDGVFLRTRRSWASMLRGMCETAAKHGTGEKVVSISMDNIQGSYGTAWYLGDFVGHMAMSYDCIKCDNKFTVTLKVREYLGF